MWNIHWKIHENLLFLLGGKQTTIINTNNQITYTHAGIYINNNKYLILINRSNWLHCLRSLRVHISFYFSIISIILIFYSNTWLYYIYITLKTTYSWVLTYLLTYLLANTHPNTHTTHIYTQRLTHKCGHTHTHTHTYT